MPCWPTWTCVLTPSAPTIYTIAEVEEDPIRLNSWLGLYTNFMNLLDYAAVAVPAGFDGRGLPFGVTLFGAAFSDQALAVYADRLHRAADLPLGATGRWSESPPLPEPVVAEPMLHLAVCGAHLSGLPLNHQLTQRGGRLLRATRTAPRYRLYALPGGPPTPPRPDPPGRGRWLPSRWRSGSCPRPVSADSCKESRPPGHRQPGAGRRQLGKGLHLRGPRRRRRAGYHPSGRLAGLRG